MFEKTNSTNEAIHRIVYIIIHVILPLMLLLLLMVVLLPTLVVIPLWSANNQSGHTLRSSTFPSVSIDLIPPAAIGLSMSSRWLTMPPLSGTNSLCLFAHLLLSHFWTALRTPLIICWLWTSAPHKSAIYYDYY